MNYLTIIIHLLKNIFGIFRLISILIFEVYMITGCNPKSGNESSIKHLRVEPEFHFIPAGITQLTGGILADRCDININNLYLAIESRYGTPIRFTKIKFQEKPLLLEVNTQKDATIP